MQRRELKSVVPDKMERPPEHLLVTAEAGAVHEEGAVLVGQLEHELDPPRENTDSWLMVVFSVFLAGL